MTEQPKKHGGYCLKSFILILIPAILYRALYLLYSNLATNVAVPTILIEEAVRYAALIFFAVMLAAAYTSITVAVYRYSAAAGLIVMLIFSGVFFADCAFRFAMDYIGGSQGSQMIIDMVRLLSEFFTQAAEVICAWMISVAFSHLHKQNEKNRLASIESASAFSLLLPFAVPFVSTVVRIFKFLVEVDWIPTRSEIFSISQDLVSVIMIYGVILFALSRIFLRVMDPDRKKSDKIA